MECQEANKGYKTETARNTEQTIDQIKDEHVLCIDDNRVIL